MKRTVYIISKVTNFQLTECNETEIAEFLNFLNNIIVWKKALGGRLYHPTNES